MSPPFLLRWISETRHPPCTHSASHFVGWRGSLGACGEMVCPRRMACEIPEWNFCWGVFWPALSHRKFSGPLLCIFLDLSSVTDFSGISQYANQQEEGQQNWTSDDQGQLHLRSLVLCSLATAPLLITAHVFPVEWKWVCCGSGKLHLCWFAKQMYYMWEVCGVKCWRDFMIKAAKFCSSRFVFNNIFNVSLNINLPGTKRIWVSLVPQNNCEFWLFYLICCVARFSALKSIELL